MEEDIQIEEEAEEEEDWSSGINVTPLVDVALTLVLIFMVTMPLSVIHGITVRRQVLERYGLVTPQETIQVHLAQGGIFVKDRKGVEKSINYEEFGTLLSEMIQISSEKHVLIQPDRDVPHGQTVWAMDLAKQNGAQDISLLESTR